MGEIKPGDIGFSNNKAGLFPSLIRFFTRSKISHTFIVAPKMAEKHMVCEASRTVQIVSFERNYLESASEEYVVVRPKLVSDQDKRNSAEKCAADFIGDSYGYFQIIWFIYRAVADALGKDVRHEKNWFTQGVICSELVWWHMKTLGGPYADLLVDLSPDTVQAEDIFCRVKERPDLFDIVFCSPGSSIASERAEG